MPVSYFMFGIIIQFCLTLGIRFSYRFILLLRGRRKAGEIHEKKVMLIGAGEAGRMLLREITFAPETQPASGADGVKTRRAGDVPA